MSSSNLLQQIKNSHSLLPASRDRPRHPLDRPWQKSQQTETCAIAHLWQKPGFCNNFCISPQYLGRNPVS
ncbi:hypothetical protein QUA86_07745 [Microcoleus sp. F6_B6]